jgi:5-methyltetrahydropteroyltriglutamate--homocysteine methyltransferase
MKRSDDRILTTHVGSLVRPPALAKAAAERALGQLADEAAFLAEVKAAVKSAVKRQAEHGIDVVTDGELGKPGFIHYINHRLSGFTPRKKPVAGAYWGASREARAFPEYYAWEARQSTVGANAVGLNRLECTGPIRYVGQAELKRDLDVLREALKDVSVAEAFVPAISCSNVEDWNANAYYKTQEEYLYAIAEALSDEYRAIVDAGFILQIDDPLLATYYVLNPDASVEDCRKWARAHVEAINHSLRGVPADRVRYHTCYSINSGPRVHDLELRHIIDIMLGINAGAYSFEASNPRHEHEWIVWKEAKLPDDKLLLPGVITHSTNVVEHPELVAQRIERFAAIVGRERVIASADCGFASLASSVEVHDSVVWAKFDALAEGARIASKRLWKN